MESSMTIVALPRQMVSRKVLGYCYGYKRHVAEEHAPGLCPHSIMMWTASSHVPLSASICQQCTWLELSSPPVYCHFIVTATSQQEDTVLLPKYCPQLPQFNRLLSAFYLLPARPKKVCSLFIIFFFFLFHHLVTERCSLV